MVRQTLARPANDPGQRQLTPRERAVLALLAQGVTNQAIAEHEHLALRSVEKVIAATFHKLDLPADIGAHRRVLAVLHHLDATPP